MMIMMMIIINDNDNDNDNDNSNDDMPRRSSTTGTWCSAGLSGSREQESLQLQETISVHTWHYILFKPLFHQMPFPVERKASGWRASGKHLLHRAKITGNKQKPTPFRLQ